MFGKKRIAELEASVKQLRANVASETARGDRWREDCARAEGKLMEIEGICAEGRGNSVGKRRVLEVIHGDE